MFYFLVRFCGVILIVILWQNQGWAGGNKTNTQLEERCHKLEGILIDGYQCPQSGVLREGRFCVDSEARQSWFFNGCTVKGLGVEEKFFDACVFHDFCYHHEPASRGWSRRQCDLEFLQNMKNICRKSSGEDLACENEATSIFHLVRLFGRTSWKCSSSKFSYEMFEK